MKRSKWGKVQSAVRLTNALGRKESSLDRFKRTLNNVRPGPQIEAMQLIIEFVEGDEAVTKKFKDSNHFRKELTKFFGQHYKKLDHFQLIADAVHLARSDVILAIADAAYGSGGFHLFKTPVADSPRPVDEHGNVIRSPFEWLALRNSTSHATDGVDGSGMPAAPEPEPGTDDNEAFTVANCSTLLHRQVVEGDLAKMTALMQAIRMSARTDFEGLQSLLNGKICGTVGASMFELACWHGNPEIVRFMLNDAGTPRFSDLLHIDSMAILSALAEGKVTSSAPEKLKAPSEMTEEELQAEIRKKEKHDDYEVVIKTLLDHAHRHDYLREQYVDPPLVYRVNVLQKLKEAKWASLIKLFKANGEYLGKLD